MNLDQDTILQLQSNTSCVRNVCILAHVDHGKTTLSDSLIASNGIISKKIAGKIRYLDSRPDEQLRGITMESSAISLFFKSINQQKQISQYLINLIDSPGHIDFSSEVSSVSRLSDGAIILIDVVEGVCSQTITVLRQAWIDNLKPILVLNKIDRLILELQLTPEDAYNHLQRLIDQTNTIIASFYNGDVIASHSTWNGDENTWIENNDDDIYFDPNLNNVIFTSAIDGWGFNLNQFASILSKKTEIPKAEFGNKLWGNYTIDMKNKKLIEIGKKSKAKPLFVSFILDSIWKIYNSVDDKDHDSILKITKSLNIKITPKELNSKDSKNLTVILMSQFLPISNAILSSIIDILPSPINAQLSKIPNLLKSIPNSDNIDTDLKFDLINCNKNGIIAGYISKMLSIPKSELPENQPTIISKDELFERGRIARLKASKAAELAAKSEMKENNDVINDNKDDNGDGQSNEAADEFEFEFDNEFEYENDEEEEDDDEEIIDNEVLIAFTRIYSGTIQKGEKITILSPLFNTALPHDDPSNIKHIHQINIDDLFILMGRDLTSVNSAPAGTIIGIHSKDFKNIVLKSGTIISNDLKSNLINFSQSLSIIDIPPIVRVTLEPTKLSNMNKLINGIKQLNLADPCVNGYLNENGEIVLETAGELHLERCINDLNERFAKVELSIGKPIVPFRETILESNDVVVNINDYAIELQLSPWINWKNGEIDDVDQDSIVLLNNAKYHNLLIKNNDVPDTFDGLFKSIFTLLIKEGPIINEPLEGIKIKIKSINKSKTDATKEENVENDDDNDNNLIRIKDILKSTILKCSARLKIATYIVNIQTSTELLGKVYTVIQKQRGWIISEEMKEGTPFFEIIAKIPILESFGFNEEIRKRTSGGAIPQLVFDGFEMIDEDPFWVPTTEEELEELGDEGERYNWIRGVMNDVRKSKGLFVDEKVVQHGEKQRTLKKD